MKKLFVTVAAALLAGAALAQMPDVKIENHQGDVINTSSLVNGKPTILSFWSTTCKPCLMELNTINDQLMDWLDEADFQVVAVSIDDTRSAAKAKALASGNGWSDFIVLYDKNQDFKRAMNVNMVPHVFVLDGEGKIVYNHTGYTPGSEAELLEVIKGLQENAICAGERCRLSIVPQLFAAGFFLSP